MACPLIIKEEEASDSVTTHYVPSRVAVDKLVLIHLFPHSGDREHMAGMWRARIRDILSGPERQQNQSTPIGQNLGLIKMMLQPSKLTNPFLGCKISTLK